MEKQQKWRKKPKRKLKTADWKKTKKKRKNEKFCSD